MRSTTEPIPLPGVPEGLEARPVVRLRMAEDGQRVEVRDRRGRRKINSVLLGSTAVWNPDDAGALDDADRRFLLGATQRRWATVVAHYGDRAWSAAVRVARMGAVLIEVPVDEALQLRTPTRWILTASWARLREDAQEQSRSDRDAWSGRAATAAEAVAGRCPELAAALSITRLRPASLPALVCAAEDLVAGRRHDGPRAFSQAHFQSTKVRDDVATVLADAGVPTAVIERLGVRRSARIGLGGRVTTVVGDHRTVLGGLDGPVILRADQPGLAVELDSGSPLVIVENLQAAETICDRWPDVGVAYTAGQPGSTALSLFGTLAAKASEVAIVPDADLGGVRIAERLISVAPAASLIDVGAQPHRTGAPWTLDGASTRGLLAACTGPAGRLAEACLARGYPVEQEALVVRAVATWLEDQ